MKKWFLSAFACLLSVIAWAGTPPPAVDVFRLNVRLLDPNTFVVKWDIKAGYFLYSDRISIVNGKDSGVRLGELRLPKPSKKTDHQGVTYNIYRQELALPVAVLGERSGEGLIEVHYQGCADDGYCYPPEIRTVKLTIDSKLALSSVQFFSPAMPSPETTAESETKQVESVFSNHHWTVTLLFFFGFGLLLSFTPCVLPMVPVLSGIIVGHGHNISTRKAFFLSLSYVSSMAVTYAIVGAIVARLGSNLQIIMQSPWVIGLFSLLFVVLAISMFGYFELKLPLSWQARLALANRSQASGHYLSAAVMGCLSTLILSPCVTAPLIGVLGYIAHSGNVIMGAFSLFFLSLGMGTPLLLIGTSAGRWLPKAGLWMNAVKYFFGVMLLAVAIYLLERILPTPLIMALWATLLVFSGIYAGALLPAHTHHDKFKQASGIIMLVYGLLILIGASMGSTSPLQPLAGWAASSTPLPPMPQQKPVSTVTEVEDAIASAHGKPVLLDFYADWCASCKSFEATTLVDPKVQALLKGFLMLKIDITANNSDDKALLRKYNVVAPPAFVFFNSQGEELPQLRLFGDVGSDRFIQQLKLAAQGTAG